MKLSLFGHEFSVTDKSSRVRMARCDRDNAIWIKVLGYDWIK